MIKHIKIREIKDKEEEKRPSTPEESTPSIGRLSKFREYFRKSSSKQKPEVERRSKSPSTIYNSNAVTPELVAKVTGAKKPIRPDYSKVKSHFRGDGQHTL